MDNLVSVSALPEMSLVSGDGGTVCISLLDVGSALVLSCAEACEEDDEGSEEQEDHGREAGPHANTPGSSTSGSVSIDVVADDAE